MIRVKVDGLRKPLDCCLCSLIIPTLLASGCAVTARRVTLADSLKATDRERCEQFAKTEADALENPLNSAIATAFGYSLLGGGGAGFAFAFFGIPYIIWRINEHSNAQTEIYNQALRVCTDPLMVEANLGPEHPDVAVSLDALAARYGDAGKLTEAEELYLRSIAIQEKALGPEHFTLAKTLESYAALLAKAGRQDEAEALARKYRSIREKAKERDSTKT